MYFNSKKEDTNIDSEFKGNKFDFGNFDFKKLKWPLIILGGVLLLVILLIVIINVVSNNSKVYYFIDLLGEDEITIYKDSDYVELGYEAYDNKNNDLTEQVQINSTVDTSMIGEYEIVYSLKDVAVTRYIKVIEKPVGATYIYLKGDLTVYLDKDEKYTEPGYLVVDTVDSNLTDKLEISSDLDTSKAGTYKVVYSVVNSSGVTTSAIRTVIVMDSQMSLSLDNANYTNSFVNVNVYIMDNYFDYLVLPDGEKIFENAYSYKVSENGTYKFKFYNKQGTEKEESITVSNIDKSSPTGSCSANYKNGKTTINVSASDNVGVNKYVLNGKSYTSNTITLDSQLTSANVIIYDRAGNSKSVSCNVKVVSSVEISSLKNDGVIVTVNAKATSATISGYYFSYNSKRPNKSGGYLATSKNSFDVVRLPGTTYVWVEDTNGNISGPKTITFDNSVFIDTKSYKYLKDIRLDTFLSNKGWSLDELNKLIYRSVRAAGLYTKTAAATVATTLPQVLAQKYQVKLPYFWGGKSYSLGASGRWGSYRKNTYGSADEYDGLDCTGFVTWAYINAGYVIKRNPDWHERGNDAWPRLTYGINNGEIGDFIDNDTHIRMIIGKTNDSYIVAEESIGMMITSYKYSKPGDYLVLPSGPFMATYEKMPESEYPSGF